MRVRVLLLDDHALVAASMRAALEPLGIDLLTVEPSPGLDVRALTGIEEVGLVLLDLDLHPQLHGLELLPSLVGMGLRVVILSATEDRLQLARALEGGALGHLSKQASFEDLITLIAAVLAGQPIHSAEERDELLAELRIHRTREQKRRALRDSLTTREHEVLVAMCRGLSAGEIAEADCVTLATVRTHIRGVLTKLGVRSQAAATAYARRAGLVDEAELVAVSP